MAQNGGGASGENSETLAMTADIVASFVAANQIPSEQLPDLIRSVHRTLSSLAKPNGSALQERPKPAAPISKSVHRDYIICLEDGKKLKMLKRYLRSTYNLSPEEYRKRWGLPSDYPMVAPAYANRRSELAKSIGLGKSSRRKGK